MVGDSGSDRSAWSGEPASDDVGAVDVTKSGAPFANESDTVVADVHSVETVLLDPSALRPRPSHDKTTVDAQAFPSSPSATDIAPIVTADADDHGDVTAERPRRLRVPEPVPPSGSSSDPPTRFVRRLDQHVDLPSGSLVDDYEIEAKIGEGAMGVVYSATHARLGRRVAIKVIAPTIGQDPQALARFEREARALATLHHPNIVDVYGFGTLPDGRSYFVMEHMRGEALDERLERGRPSLDEALDLVDQMARGLEAAHAQGIVHRDLKPSNTFLAQIARERRSVVKLIDFGLVKASGADGVEDTASGVVIGTALYISPEQARGPDVDGRTDIYALGCIAYELILGRHPFPAARTPTAAIAAHLTETPPQPRTIWPEIPAALDLLLFSMLAKDPNYRPTLAQVRHVLDGLRSQTIEDRAKRAATVSVRRGALRARAWTAAGIVLALVVGIAIGARAIGAGEHAPASTFSATEPIFDGGEAQSPTQQASGAVTAPLVDAAVVVADVQMVLSDASSADGGETARVIPPRPPRPSSPSLGVATGALSLDSKPWTDVLVDGSRVGRTPIVGVRLAVGQHKVTLINTKYGIKESFRVEISAGKAETMIKDYSDRPEVRDKFNALRK